MTSAIHDPHKHIVCNCEYQCEIQVINSPDKVNAWEVASSIDTMDPDPTFCSYPAQPLDFSYFNPMATILKMNNNV